jgi:hypothetical protein
MAANAYLSCVELQSALRIVHRRRDPSNERLLDAMERTCFALAQPGEGCDRAEDCKRSAECAALRTPPEAPEIARVVLTHMLPLRSRPSMRDGIHRNIAVIRRESQGNPQ